MLDSKYLELSLLKRLPAEMSECLIVRVPDKKQLGQTYICCLNNCVLVRELSQPENTMLAVVKLSLFKESP